MSHYVMVCEGDYPSAVLRGGPEMDNAPWNSGRVIKRDFELPLVYLLERRKGNLKAMYDETAYPIMSEALIAALRSAGVDNLQLFDAVVENPRTGERHT